ncbi:MAG: tRNA (adenosine(37)-N6)-dimethylallyltransferase MiaA [Planctomycetales bacterium 4572_13]|nr:MAG: tRNA (adenosine(37)-N6)-dimethylallyltransferase MiaA [Planctomycetales bacterium 4572_13]
MEIVNPKILILGVTASGKSTLAFELSKTLNAEIISVDSMKVYRRMDIGTAKPPAEKRNQIPYHLIDVVEPSEAFSVDRFLDLTEKAASDIQDRGKPVIAVGGTAMYIKALLFGLFDGPGTDEAIRNRLKAEAAESGLAKLHQRLTEIDPTAAERIHPNDEKRIIRALEVYELTGKPISSFQKQWEATQPANDWFVIGLRRDKETESKRINARIKRMMEAGLVDEVAALLAEDKPLSPQAAAAIGYAEIISHLNGEMELDETIEKIKINTRRFAKSQRTWFKTFKNVNWLDITEDDTVESVLTKTLWR